MATPLARPPVAKIIPTERSYHGDTVIDHYAWMADADDAETMAYVEAENAYTESRTADQGGLREEIFNEIRTRTRETDLSLPVRKNGYWYYQRTVEGRQYAIHCRRAVLPAETVPPSTEAGEPLEGEQILLDGNIEAGESEYFALGALDVSPDGNRLAYSVDLTGEERFVLRVKDLSTGEVLPDEIPGVSYGSAWSYDASVLFYERTDAAWRPFQVWRHTIGTATDHDVLVLEEPDERFWVGLELSHSEEYVVIELRSNVTSEVHLIQATAPTEAPRLVAARREGVEYSVDHDADHARLLILHNDGAEDFALAWTPVENPGTWHEILAHSPGTRLLSVSAFSGAIVVPMRSNGLTGLRVLPTSTGAGEPYDISFPEAVYTVALDHNLEYDTDRIRLRYVSLVTPESIYDYDLNTRDMVLRRQTPVLGGYDPEAYEQHREWAVADDGTRVPMSIVCRRGTPRDGSAPAVLYGYGSYEACIDPRFSVPRLSLLDRGFVYVTAHVRGGGEMGRPWYNEGKMLAKKNTFTDFATCARHLVKEGWTSRERLVVRGGSAGGLLVAAVVNLAPDIMAGAVAQVPFVDPLTTILDPALPLTVTEWEEWGNPLESPSAYAYIKSYSPYENVAPVRYPEILAMASLNDPRVRLREPLRWIARLRAVAPGNYLLKTGLETGHSGRSGRYDAWREEAFVLAWIITLVSPDTQTK